MSKLSVEGVVLNSDLREKKRYSREQILEVRVDSAGGLTVIQMESKRFKGAMPVAGDMITTVGRERRGGHLTAKVLQNLTTGGRLKA